MAYIQSYEDQVWLLQPSIEELIPEDHICFLVKALVDSMDFRPFDIIEFNRTTDAGTIKRDGVRFVQERTW